jgi:ABC-2 type transport system ATP-binding protein
MNFLEKARDIFRVRFLRQKKPALEADSVKFAYDDQEVLRNINLNVKEGIITSIIGKSGCGKSTFLKLAAGIISRKFYGDISVLGKKRMFAKDKIGFVPQELAYIPDLSILDNIKISGLNLGIREREAVKKAQKLMTLLKLDEDVNKKPEQLSGGQKVRLNIILSVLHNPKVLILDEPFVGLDFYNRRLLWHFLESMKKKRKSVILTSHLLSEVQEHVDRLVIIKNGRVFFSGKMESLKNKLKMQYVFEVRFSYLSKEGKEKIKKYCDYYDFKILDSYERYMMFALASEKRQEKLLKLFSKMKLQYEITGMREPNLDEIFLSA